MHLVFTKQVAHGEVVQLNTYTTDDTRLSPTERELQLVVRLLLEVPLNINSTILVIGFGNWVDLLRIEESHRGNFTSRTRQSFLGEQVAWLGAQLTTNDLFIQTVVTINTNLIDMSLRTLLDTHLKVDGVAYNIDLGRLQVVEQVTIVPVVVAHGIFVFRQTLIHQLLVIDVALPHAQYGIQIIGCYNRITYPSDITNKILLSLFYLHKDVHMLLIVVPYGVFENNSITETKFVILVDKSLLGLVIALLSEFLGLEHVL